jgi:magnesium chelatase family protein
MQKRRYAGLDFSSNARIPAGFVDRFCALDDEGRSWLSRASETIGISSRAFHSVLRVARTIADLAGVERIETAHLTEAVRHRRYGDGDYFWVKSRI